MAEEKKTQIKPVDLQVDRIIKLFEIVEAVARCRLEPTFPINALALIELEQHGAAAQEELDKINKEKAEEAAKKAEEDKKKAEEEAKKEEEANKVSQASVAAQGGGVRRDLPPLSPPPAR